MDCAPSQSDQSFRCSREDAFITLTNPEVLKLFSCSTQLSMKFFMLINLRSLTIANVCLLNLAEHENVLLINMKLPTIVGIFIFISRENFMLS